MEDKNMMPEHIIDKTVNIEYETIASEYVLIVCRTQETDSAGVTLERES